MFWLIEHLLLSVFRDTFSSMRTHCIHFKWGLTYSNPGWLFVVVQWLSHVQLCEPMSFTVSQSFLKLMSIKSVMPSNHLILCHPLLLLPSIFPSIRAFSDESALHIRWPKFWSFSFSTSPSNIQGWFPLGLPSLISLQSKRLFKSFLHHSSKSSILRCSPFFRVHLSHLSMITGKTIALTIWTFLSAKCCLWVAIEVDKYPWELNQRKIKLIIGVLIRIFHSELRK